MNLPDGFDSDPTRWLETWFPCEAVLDTYPMIIRILVQEYDLEQEEVLMALPADADVMESLGLNVYSLPEHPVFVSECPDHPTRREYFLAYLTGLQLIWRIREKFPEAANSPHLAMLLLYNGLQAAKREKLASDSRFES